MPTYIFLKKYRSLLSITAWMVFTTTTTLLAQDITSLGGDLSSSRSGKAAIQVTAPNVTDEVRRQAQLDGFGIFHKEFSKSEGLGPNFVNGSCGGCHINNGKGPVSFRSTAVDESTAVVKVSLPKNSTDGAPVAIAKVGSQLQDSSVFQSQDLNRVKIKVRWQILSGSYPDGTKYTLRKPVLSFRNSSTLPKKFRSSLRIAPSVIGVGLLDSIPESTILSFIDSSDSNNDGVIGHANYVFDDVQSKVAIGRFGYKATHTTVIHQSTAALKDDMGVTSSVFKGISGSQELSDHDLNILILYQTLAGVPFARNQENQSVIKGKNIFQSIGCDACHRMTIQTGDVSAIDPELANQIIHPFTDLLLHNMGQGLSDRRPDFRANGVDWRTTPLWGLGFQRRIATRSLEYLHDGRARSVEEAILWHGGEASKSQKAFKNLSKSQRKALLLFLDSL